MTKEYRICPTCGRYNGLLENTCSCGEDISQEKWVLRETVPSGMEGIIGVYEKYYVQTCPHCGQAHYMESDKKPFRSCLNCMRIIKNLKPVFVDEKLSGSEDVVADEKLSEFGETKKRIEQAAQAAGMQTGQMPTEQRTFHSSMGAPDVSPVKVRGQRTDDKSPSDEPVPAWDDVIKSHFTLTALDDPRVVLELDSDKADGGVMLGRTGCFNQYLLHYKGLVNGAEEVGKNHARVLYMDGIWYVEDNDSRFGTFVDGKQMPKGGRWPLTDSCILRLGCRDDSPEFKVRIKV